MERLEDVGYRVTDKIYISSEYEANSPEWLKEHGIQAILNVSRGAAYDSGGLQSIWMGFPDDYRATDEEIKKAVKALQYLCGMYERVLVHCRAGVSRSPTVVAIFLALQTGNSFKHCLDFVARGRTITDPNKNFRQRGQRIVDEMKAAQ